ncbi:MAG: nuclear transport factor 2 family protein [Gemmatimonadota bacterium]|nr:nuclear transport factor 2 family protein [Gemmatimonadota bacterium]
MTKNADGEVQDLLDSLKNAVMTGDSAALEQILAEDVCAFFSGGDAPVRGRDAVLATWTRHFERWCDVRIERRDTVSETRGNVAWCQFLWDGEGRMGAHRYRLEGERWTVVLRRENGCWRFVQMHSSLPYRDWEAHRTE